MKPTALRAGALGCALLFTTALTAPALGQTATAYRQLDANGVDVTHGDFLMSAVEGSIGSGAGELALARTAIDVGTGGGAYHISPNGHQWDRIFLNQETLPGGGVRVTVNLGAQFEQFNGTGTLPTGSTLIAVGSDYHYRTADGAVIAFSDPSGQVWGGSTYCNGSAGQTNCLLLPASIAAPDGKTVSVAWELWSSCEGSIEEDNLFCSYYPRLYSVSNSLGYRIAFSYASQGNGPGGVPPDSWQRRTAATFHNDAAGGAVLGSVSYSHPANGVVETTDMGGRVWRFSGNNARVTALRRPGASSDTTSVSYSGNQVTSVTRDGVTTGYSRSVTGSTATMTVTDALSQATTVVSNLTIGRPTSITDPLSRQTQFQYDGNARLTRATRPEGDYVQYSYDARGNITETRAVAKSGSGLSDIVASASYDTTCSNPVTCNSPNSTTDARGNVTNYAYDSTHGGVLSVTAPAPGGSGDRPETRYSYTLTNGEYRVTGVSTCASGTAPSCVGTASETVTTIAYDANGNVTSATTADGTGAITAPAAMTYDALGNLLTVDGPLSGSADTVRYRYNAARQMIGAAGPDPDGGGSLAHRAVRATYTNGLPTSIEAGTVASQSDSHWAAFSALERVEQDYDANARPTVQRLMSGSTTHALSQTSYDALGRVQCAAQRMNPNEFGSLPSDACTLDDEGSFGPDRIVKTTYDNAGQVTQVQTGYGVTGVVADEVRTTYTDNGRVATVTDAEDNRTAYEYDGHDRLRNTRFPSPTTDGVSAPTSGAGADYEQLTYDAAGNVTTRRLRDGTSIVHSYDNLNRLTARDLPNTGWWEYDQSFAWDNLGRLVSAGNSVGHVQSWSYDALSRLTQETSNWYGAAASYAYDAAGRMTRLTWPDGLYIDYDHLVTGEVGAIRENGATSGAGVLGAYAYDDRGRRTSLTRGNGTVTGYSYDDVSRLTGLVQDLGGTTDDLTLGFSYNPASQIVSVSRSNDAYAWGGHYEVSRAYTANGLNQYTAAGSITPTYDARGNLTSAGSITYAYTSDNLLATAPGAGFVYDALGRLLGTTAAGTLLRYGPGSQVIAENDDTTNAIRRRYVHGPGVDEPLVWYEGTGTSDRRWLHADERGSVVAISNGSGAVTNINAYDESGIPASTNVGRFQYTGQQWLAELGMYHYRARIYSPTLGRFLQTDPIGYGGGMNLYAYVLNDPVNFVDPSGLKPKCLDTPGAIDVCGRRERPDNGASILGLAGNWSSLGPSMFTPEGPMADGGGGACPAIPESNPIGETGRVGAALRNPIGAVMARDIASAASEAAAARFPELSGHNDMRDAYRHFYWSFAMSRMLGLGPATLFGNANEVSGNNPPREQAMDVHNNAMARAMAVDPANRNRPTSHVAEEAMRNGCLETLE